MEKRKGFISSLIFFLLVLLMLLSSCVMEHRLPTESKNEIKIMPFGASRVEGNRPEYESFRYELWKKLIQNGYSIDFIGTQIDNGSYPSVSGIDFDINHEGGSGGTSGELLNGLKTWLDESTSPDIVLLSSPGGNDALENLPFNQTISNISAIIDLLQTTNPDITIIIEQMAPAHSDYMTSDLFSYIEGIYQEMVKLAKERTTDTSKIILVDMYTEFKDEFLADDIHYNEKGAKYIADRYYTVLVEVLDEIT